MTSPVLNWNLAVMQSGENSIDTNIQHLKK